MKFSVGDLVIEKKSIRPHTSYQVQKVIGILDGALLLQHYGVGWEEEIHDDHFTPEKPGSRGWREALHRYQEIELLTPKEARAEQLRLEAAENKINKEFDAVHDQVKDKLEQAAALVKAAAVLVKAHDREFCDLKIDCMPLYRALDEGGWSHSTMRC